MSSSYTVLFSGTFTSTGIAQAYAPSYYNELEQTEQGVQVLSATGTRIYTDTASGTVTVLGVTGLGANGSFVGNGNMLYPNGPLVTDWDGIAFKMNGTVPIAGQSSTVAELVFWWEGSVDQYLEESAGSSHEVTPTQSGFTVVPYSSYSGGSLSCQLPSTVSYYTFCSQIIGPDWTSVMSGLLHANNLPMGSAGQTSFLITSASGVRYFTNTTTGNVTISTIVALAAPGQLGGNDNLLYVNPTGAVLDGDGLTFVFDSQPPIAGQNNTDPNLQMNFWFDGSGQYLEETAGGTHESAPNSSVVTLQVASAGAAIPTCALPSTAFSTSPGNAGLAQYTVCSYLVATTYTSSLTAVLTLNSTVLNSTGLIASGTPAYSAVSGPVIGSRTYVNLTAGTTQVAVISALNPTGSTGGNDNLIYPGSYPTLDGDGITLHFLTDPYIAGRVSVGPDMNLWYEGPQYLEETASGTHEANPVLSAVSFTPYTSGASSGLGPQCNLPSVVQWSFCYVMIGSDWTVLFSGLVNTSAIAQTVTANSNNQLLQDQQAFTVTAATGTRIYTNTTAGTSSTTSILGVAPGFVGATQYLYFGYGAETDWNGIAFNMSGTVAIAGEPNAGSQIVVWWQSAITQYLEETQSSHHENTPIYSTLTFQPYLGTPASCAIPSQAQTVIYYSFCSVLQGSGWSSTISGVLSLQNVVLQEPNAVEALSNAYLVLAANGTRVFTNATVTQTATIVQLAPLGSTGGNDNLLFFDSSIVLDGNGLTFEFDVMPYIQGEPLGTTTDNEMNFWFDGPTYLEETKGSTHETTPTTSTVTIAPWTGGAVTCPANSSSSTGSPSGSGTAGASSTAAASSGTSTATTATSSSSTTFVTSPTSAASSTTTGIVTSTPTSTPVSTVSSSSSSGGSNAGGGGGGSGLSGGQIAGIVIGSVVGGLLLLALCVMAFVLMGRNKGKSQTPVDSSEASRVSQASMQPGENYTVDGRRPSRIEPAAIEMA